MANTDLNPRKRAEEIHTRSAACADPAREGSDRSLRKGHPERHDTPRRLSEQTRHFAYFDREFATWRRSAMRVLLVAGLIATALAGLWVLLTAG